MRLNSSVLLRLGAVVAASALVMLSARVDWGEAWPSIGPEGGTVRALAFDRLDAGILYAGTLKGGVFRSLDGAQTWQRANAGLAGMTVVDIAVGPLTPSRVFAATDAAGVFRSADRGLMWRACNAGVDVPALRAIAIDPAHPAVLLAASFGGGIYRSDDACASWRTFSAGLGESFVLALAADTRSPGTFYAGTQGGLFRLAADAARWVALGDPAWYVQDMVLAPDREAIHIAVPGEGVLTSLDAGRTWLRSNEGLTDLMVAGLDIAPGGEVYAQTQSGKLFRSSDGARSWHGIESWPSQAPVETLAIDPGAADHLYAGTDFAGVRTSRDGGKRWQAVNRGLHNLQIETLAAGAAADGGDVPALYAGSRYSGLFRSIDGGLTWQSGRGLPDPRVSAILADPLRPSRVYAAVGRGQLFVSDDRGAVWSALGPAKGLGSPLHALAGHPLAAGVLLAGGASGRLFGSQDGGQHWRSVADFPGAMIQHIVFDPVRSDTVYLGTNRGIYVRETGSAPWLPANAGLLHDDVQALAIDPVHPNVIFAATYGGGVHRSEDAGAHWQARNAGLTDLHLRTIALDPAAPDTLYAGSRSGRIFRSDDGGSHWRIINDHTDLPPITTLVLDPAQPRRIFAATAGNSVVAETQPSGWTWVGAIFAALVAARMLLARPVAKQR